MERIRIEAADRHVGNQRMVAADTHGAVAAAWQLQAATGSYRQLLGECPEPSEALRERLKLVSIDRYIGALGSAR